VPTVPDVVYYVSTLIHPLQEALQWLRKRWTENNRIAQSYTNPAYKPLNSAVYWTGILPHENCIIGTDNPFLID